MISNYKHWDSAYLCQGTSCPDLDWIRDPDRQKNLVILIIGPLATFPGNSMQIRLEVFAQSC